MALWDCSTTTTSWGLWAAAEHPPPDRPHNP